MVSVPLRKFLAALPGGLLAVSMTSCVVGPHQLRRSVDDWDQRLYVNSPWFDAALWIVPVIPVAFVGATICDVCIGNPLAFWGRDAWSGRGTGFRAAEHLPPSGSVGSLAGDGSFLKLR